MASNDSNAAAYPPVIGLTTYLEQAKQGVWDVRAAFLPEQYFQAVIRSGGAATLLPPQPESAASAVLAGLDGLILTGGLDVQPELYGADRHPSTDPARADRDAWELALFGEARARRLPVFAICRGLQLVNVALGGTLQQHLPESLGTEKFRIGGGVFAQNTVQVRAGTALANLLGAGPYSVQSYHHQGIDQLAPGLMVTADNPEHALIQAVTFEGDDSLVAVQWHPEESLDDLRLFQDLVHRAARYATARQQASVAAIPTPEISAPDVSRRAS